MWGLFSFYLIDYKNKKRNKAKNVKIKAKFKSLLIHFMVNLRDNSRTICF